ncbi:MAG: hypothetical protein KDH09_00660 [Chrysiogenetes bacterium]|nr:hypothetical protein [Chrysiogenetes bacterium]
MASTLCAALFLGACAKGAPEAGSADWNRRLERGDVIIDARDIPSTGLKLATVTAVVDAPPPVVWEVFQDAGEFRRFLYQVKDSAELERRDGNRYFRISIEPDALARMVTGDITFTAEISEVVDTQAGVWRGDFTGIEGNVERVYGAWRLETYSNNRTLVQFSTFIDLGYPGTIDLTVNSYTANLLGHWADDLRDYVRDRGVRMDLEQRAAARAAGKYDQPVTPMVEGLDDLMR